MAMRGGYQIVDLKNNPFTSGQESNIEGLYNIASSHYGKPTLISGLNVGGIAYPDFFAPMVANDEELSVSVVIGGKTVSIVIDIDDNITVTVA